MLLTAIKAAIVSYNTVSVQREWQLTALMAGMRRWQWH